MPATITTTIPDVRPNTTLVIPLSTGPPSPAWLSAFDHLHPHHPSPFDPSRWASALRDYPDQPTLHQVLLAIRYGVRLGFTGPRSRRLGTNHASATQHPIIITENIRSETSLDRTRGPFTELPFPNFRASPLGTHPKSSGGLRRIHDLSWPHDRTSGSVNAHINVLDFPLAYSSFDEAITHIISVGPGAILSKSDLDAAFRHIIVHCEDWELLGFSWDAQWYFDVVLPFGCRSSPFLYNVFAELLHWLTLALGVVLMLHYVDDFLFIEHPDQKPVALSVFARTCYILGFQRNPAKEEGPCTRLPFLGITLDSAAMTASLPPPKLADCLRKLATFTGRRTCTRHDLESLVGSLSFAARVVPSGRPFLFRLIQACHSVPHKSQFVTLSAPLQEDLAWWAVFLPSWHGSALLNWSPWLSSTEFELSTDASGSVGFACVYRDMWYQERWDDPAGLATASTLSPHLQPIHWKELFAVVVAAATFGPMWDGSRVRLLCDNTNVVGWINSNYCNIPDCNHLLRLLSLLSAQHHFILKALWLPSLDNALADALSRYDNQRFHALAPSASPTPTQPGTLPTGTFRAMWRRISTTGSLSPPAPPIPPRRPNSSPSAPPTTSSTPLPAPPSLLPSSRFVAGSPT